jgi:hypothetical protein
MIKQFLPYLVPLLVVALLLRRSLRAQKLNPNRMWIRPVIFTVLAITALAAGPVPGLLVIAAYVLAAAVGAGLGYLRAHHQKLSIDPQTGAISSQATIVGTLIIFGLFIVRIGVKVAFPQVAAGSHVRGEVAQVTNGLLIFMVAMLIAQWIFLRSRTQPLLAAHAARTASPE